MPHPIWFEQFSRKLSQRGLPRAYVERLMQELREHAEDAGDDVGSLGDPCEVAAAAVDTFRASHFCGRYPALMFLLAPIVSAILGWNLYVMCGIAFIERIGGAADSFSVAMSYVLVFLSRFLVPLAVTYFLWCLFQNSGRPKIWFRIGCTFVAVLAGMYLVDFRIVEDGPELMVTFQMWASAWQIVQFAVVAGFAFCLERRRPVFVC